LVGEDQLAGEAEHVQRLAPVGGDKRAVRVVVLAQQQVGLGAGAKLRVMRRLRRAGGTQLALQR
jgi:hypothetical protein